MRNDDLSTKLLRGLDALKPVVRNQSAEADRRFTLTDDVIAALQKLELFRLWIPERDGGFELSLPTTLEVYEAAARIDGSLGWTVMIGAGGGLFGAYLAEDVAADVFSSADALIAGSGAPQGRAEKVANGYRASGRWRYASGAPHATAFTANCVVTRDGEPLLSTDGRPVIRAMVFTPADVTILDTWRSVGLRGTASHDIEVEDVFVPEARTFSVFMDAPRVTGPLYRVPFEVLTELPVAAVALGIARHLLEAFAELAATKKPFAQQAVLADNEATRVAFAKGRATWRHSKAAVSSLADGVWRAAVAGQSTPAETRAEITATCALGVANLTAAAGELSVLAGMTAIDQDAELGRAWRDLLALGAHVSVSPHQLAAAGECLLNADAGGDSATRWCADEH